MFLVDTLSRAFPVSETVRNDPEMLNIDGRFKVSFLEFVSISPHWTVTFLLQGCARDFPRSRKFNKPYAVTLRWSLDQSEAIKWTRQRVRSRSFR
ncbi:hypothetical protein TNCV_2990451 [Trichonephila clavipes]|nr:hypothetical protein TNCV_2990451 [Trichonephila clavipes]